MTEPEGAAAGAKRTLFDLGHEIPGHRLRRLATQLLIDVRQRPDASPQSLVERAVAAIEDGPTALVDEEPGLRTAPLDPPAATVEQGLTATVTALGHRLVAEYRLSSSAC